ncbi:tyrosine-type recombinase/integrase [Anoxynatronum buryatiense]|uniref:Site-specific recombinase XerD n=1 Tax=Anoxynatronum buryatiense TaxID=489973 RepID=A0AA45WXR8_9CLOT|nr:tyrosine-type recombinase/integrase [Anoxynatronum buryatiense]SMP65743.1 Site-specific recombinase XerD [Anoxynatronum buryatiense]
MIQFRSVLQDEITDFLALRKETKSKSTYDHDCHTFRFLDNYLCSINCDDKNLTEEQMTGWSSTLGGKSSSIANVVRVIKTFLVYLKGYGVNAYIPPVPKVSDDYIPYIFSDGELKLIFSIADTLQKTKPRKNNLIHVEFPMILRLMCGCGLRIGETLSLRVKDVDFDIGVLTLRHTKGDKQRLSPMHPSLTKIMRQYCMAMGMIGCPEAYLFPTSDPTEPVTAHNTQHKFDFILEQGNIFLLGRKKHQRGPCLHCLRHVFVFQSFAKAEQEGRRIDDIVPYLSIYLGHDSLKETEKYMKFSSEMFPDAMELFDGYTAQVFPEVNFSE